MLLSFIEKGCEGFLGVNTSVLVQYHNFKKYQYKMLKTSALEFCIIYMKYLFFRSQNLNQFLAGFLIYVHYPQISLGISSKQNKRIPISSK